MAILTFPSVIPSRCTWGLQFNSERFISPLDGTVQAIARPGARWKATLEFRNVDLARGAALDAFLASLGGQAGRFTMYPFHRPVPSIASTSTDNVTYGGKNSATQVILQGFSVSRVVIKQGDFFMLGGELKMATTTTSSNGGGMATVDFAPPLRGTPAFNSPVQFTNPTATFMLDSDTYEIAAVATRYDNVTFSCTEVLT